MVQMSYGSRMRMYSIIFFFVMISLALVPFYYGQPFTGENIASAFIIILVGVVFPLVSFKPQWNKAVLFFEGILFAFLGYNYLANPINYIFLVFGLILVAISLLAYVKKLPPKLLKFFYHSR